MPTGSNIFVVDQKALNQLPTAEGMRSARMDSTTVQTNAVTPDQTKRRSQATGNRVESDLQGLGRAVQEGAKSQTRFYF